MLDKRYQTLVVLADTNSFTKTAETLFITQPAVSQQITSLENELNLSLVIRDHNRIHLTDIGQKLADYAKQVEFESQKVLNSLKTPAKFNMGCTLSLSSTLLPKFLNHLSNKIQISTTEIKNTDHILQNIRDGKIDFGLVEGNFDTDEFDSFFLQKENFVCISHQQLNISTIEDLFNQTLLIREPGSGSRNIFENWLATQNYKINDFNKVMEIASPNTILELLKQISGVTFIYESLVTSEIKNGQLKKLDFPGFKIEHPINLVFLKNSYFKNTYQELTASYLQETNSTTY
ncbi:LysR family transcriptional regulator [Companilactobacillus bobalius]|uniref:Transcriptional regulator n=2 Tax=Companilactobacillus bobalius TaxID=2801451 RepID=A0A0R1KLZ5_9LACO|nr:LysR family transcriptional regulator [Companilactobacillus bobalius]KAE9558820.1 transcriptional regulator [Companilactobacillus bobalius]KRK84144.1 transcriptional regulator [Companilactobacillus bobalius DSM 19674]OVE97163.1 putative HTH-type transcriptional regulator YbhD [Companilactobacillus bobalius]GEO59611.1 LysR family transcriptional regulator [Companilactobacillus paralimentarius]